MSHPPDPSPEHLQAAVRQAIARAGGIVNLAEILAFNQAILLRASANAVCRLTPFSVCTLERALYTHYPDLSPDGWQPAPVGPSEPTRLLKALVDLCDAAGKVAARLPEQSTRQGERLRSDLLRALGAAEAALGDRGGPS